MRANALTLFPTEPAPIALTADIETLLARDCVVAVGVSGGKDSQACALAVARHLDAIGHCGPRILVHADLGRVEWRDSLPVCERLAAHLGWELLVVRRKAGDMLARWQGRWANNLQRYRDLSCVRLILPWSTPSMRFCTSELKVDVITSALKKRFPDQDIVNVAGIRRQESSARARMPVAKAQAKLTRKGRAGFTWNAIIDWDIEQVFATIAESGLALHEAYTKYGASRVSCVSCIMSSEADLKAGASCPDNAAIYREMVTLELDSTFAFQGNRWLADVAPDLLPPDLRARVPEAKARAAERIAIEAEIPKHLLYTDGWPTTVPTDAEAALLADVRRRMARLLAIDVECDTAESVQARYRHLIAVRDRSTPDALEDPATDFDNDTCIFSEQGNLDSYTVSLETVHQNLLAREFAECPPST